MATIRPGSPVFVGGEGPGPNELLEGEGFVGASGRIVNQALAEGGVPRKEASISNACLCAPPEDTSYGEYTESLQVAYRRELKRWAYRWAPGADDKHREKEADRCYEAATVDHQKSNPRPSPPVMPHEACRPRFERDIADSNSTVILAVGKVALESTASILGVSVASIAQQHGAPVLLPDGRVLMSAYHPAFAMRDKREYMPVIRENIARAARIARRGGKIAWSWPRFLLMPDEETITRTLRRFLETGAEVTVDIETDGIDPHACLIRCIGFGARIDGDEVVIVVPFRHRDGSPWWADETKIRLALLCREVLDGLPLVLQNGQFDTTALLRFGLMTARDKTWFDTRLAHKNTTDCDLPHDLGFITRRYFEVVLWKEDIDHKSGTGQTDSELHEYCGKDVTSTARDADATRAEIERLGTTWAFETDTKMAPHVRDMSELGMPVNEWQRGRFSAHLNHECAILRAEFQKTVGKKINPRSVPQLRELFYSTWDYDPVIATDGFDWDPDEDDEEDGSTSNAALTRLMKERAVAPEHARVIDLLFQFRANDKMRGTYVDNLKTYPFHVDDLCLSAWGRTLEWAEAVRGVRYNKETDEDELIEVLPRRPGLSLARTTFKQVVPTGRLSSGDPTNFQNISKRARGGLNMRDMFVAPPGHLFVGADYEQIEARLYALIAQDRLLLDAIAQGLDLHSLNCASLLAKPGEDIMDVYKWLKAKPKDELVYWRTVAKRFCIAEGELVLTDRGEIPIEDVRPTDKVWDGVEWVSHDGVVFQGLREVIEYDGLRATADHKVWLADGRKVEFGHAATSSHRLAQTGEGRNPLVVNQDEEYASQQPSGIRRALEADRVRVFDILNAGPRRRFTVSGRLVSNCFL